MKPIRINYNKILNFIPESRIFGLQGEMNRVHSMLMNRTGKGNDFLGWIDLPENIDEGLMNSIIADAEKIRSMAEVFVVIGIGGSYLGSRAVIEALKDPFDSFSENKNPVVLYAGHNLSEDYTASLLSLLDSRDYAVAVISKSGTTTEPAVAFRLIKDHLEKKYGDKASERIIAITDEKKGALKTLAGLKNYKTYVIPDDVGGRYSVLTPVGLLPIAVAGFDIAALVDGAGVIRKEALTGPSLENNTAALYAAIRNVLYRDGKFVEIMVNYEPSLLFFSEWWKQLYGESEGKDGKGIFPASVNFTTDLHSLGQYIQDGKRIFFETVLTYEHNEHSVEVPYDKDDLDKLNFLKGKRLGEINRKAGMGTMLAHVDGGVPNLEISFEKRDEFHLGALIYFFEAACALSGYLLDVNPFDQPGVEAYKKNMFALLGKPGFEKEGEQLLRRLKE